MTGFCGHRLTLVALLLTCAGGLLTAGGTLEMKNDAAAALKSTTALESMAVKPLEKPVSVPDTDFQLLSGDTVSLAEFRGSFVLLNVWAMWCEPCKLEMPSMERLVNRFNTGDLVVLALNYGEAPNRVSSFIEEYRYTFPVGLDFDRKLSKRLGVRGLPTTFILNRRSEIIGVKAGTRFWDTPEVYEAFETLLKGEE